MRGEASCACRPRPGCEDSIGFSGVYKLRLRRSEFADLPGQVVLKLKTPWRDDTTHQGTPPLEFMQRLAALVPRPRLHLIRFHGVLAPSATTSAKPAAMVVPQGPDEGAQAAPPAECEANCAHLGPARLSWAKLLKRVFSCDITWVQVSLR